MDRRVAEKIASYPGLNLSEESSCGRRRLGAISKQGASGGDDC